MADRDLTNPLFISCDEAGHTGPDLLNREQRYFAFGSVSISDDEAYEIIEKARRDHPVQMPELKSARLMRSDHGKALIAAVVSAADGRFAVNVHEKLLALCGWVFEYIYEPVYKENPRLLYEKNLHRFVAMYTWLFFNNSVQAEESIRQFQAYMRSMNEADAPLLFNRVQNPPASGEQEHPFDMVLRFAHGYRRRIIADNEYLTSLSADGGRWTLDLSISALWSHLNHWGSQKRPLKVICDASKPLEAYANKFTGDQNDPGIKRAQMMNSPGPFGWRLVDPIAFVDSRNHPAVQLADIIAGAVVSFVTHGVPDNMKETSQRIEAQFLKDSIVPDLEVIDLNNKAAAVNWLILYDLSQRAMRDADPYKNLAEMYWEAEVSWARGDYQLLKTNIKRRSS